MNPISIAIAPPPGVQKEIAALQKERFRLEYEVECQTYMLDKAVSLDASATQAHLESVKAELFIVRSKINDSRKSLEKKHRAWGGQIIKDAPAELFALRKEFVARIEEFRSTIYANTDFAPKKSLFVQYQEMMEIIPRRLELAATYAVACAITGSECLVDMFTLNEGFWGEPENFLQFFARFNFHGFPTPEIVHGEDEPHWVCRTWIGGFPGWLVDGIVDQAELERRLDELKELERQVTLDHPKTWPLPA
jgi:hypothetical protein